MKHLKSYLLIVIFVAMTSTASSQQESLPLLIKRIKPAVVAIVTYDSKGEEISQGSGFFIAQNRIITNRHVIEDADRAEVRTANGQSYPVQSVIAADLEGDLALVTVSVPPSIHISPLVVASTVPLEGERVLVIGNPLGLEGTISDGLVSAVRELRQFGTVIQITAPISPGSSGSPVINMRGQVVGIATSQLTEGQNLNFAMPSTRIAALRPGLPKTLVEFAMEVSSNNRAKAARLVLQGRAVIWTTMKKQTNGSYKFEPEEYKKANEKAIPFFLQATRLSSDFSTAWSELGGAYYAIDKYAETVSSYEQAVRLDPNDWSSFYNMAGALDELKEYKAAIDALQKVIRLAPRSTITLDAAILMGDIWFFDLKNSSEAVNAYRRGIGVMQIKDPTDDKLRQKLSIALFSLGVDYGEAGRHSEAIDTYQEVIALKAGSEAGAYNAIGDEYADLKRYREALESYRSAIALKPDFYIAYGSVAYVYLFGFENNRAAIDACLQALRINPDYDYGHYYLGVAYLFNGNKSAALDEYKILRPLNSKLADKLFNSIYDK